MSDREDILRRIRNRLGQKANDRGMAPLGCAMSADRVIDGVGQGAQSDGGPTLLSTFSSLLVGQGAVVQHAATSDHVVPVVAQYLSLHDLGAEIRIGCDRWLNELSWQAAPDLVIKRGAAAFSDRVGMTRAIAGVAEIGGVVVASSASNPTTLNFVPDTHIVVVRAADIVATYEDVWQRLRCQFGSELARAISFITGPSRTADIGGRPVVGAHGPKRLTVCIVGAAA